MADYSGDSAIDSNFGEMYIADSAAAIVVNAADEWHAVDTPVTGYQDGFTFEAGVTEAITTVATDAGGILVTTSGAHSLAIGDIITINNCATGGNEAYNDIFEVLTVPSSVTFTVNVAYAATDTGSVQRGSNLTCNAAGVYQGQWSAAGISETNAHIFDFAPAVNTTISGKAKSRRKFSNADYGSFGGGGLMIFLEGDKITFNLQNVGADGNVTIRTLDLSIHRL